MTSTSSRVTARSVSSVVTPIAIAAERRQRVLRARARARRDGPGGRRPRRRARPRATSGSRDERPRAAAHRAARRGHADARALRGSTTNSGRRPARMSTMLVEPGRRHVVEALVGPAQRVRRDDDVVHRQQRIVGGDRLLLEHVERRAGDLPARERVDQRRFVDDRSARDVDEIRVGFIRANCGAPTRCRVSSFSRQQTTTKSDSRISVSRSTLRAPR